MEEALVYKSTGSWYLIYSPQNGWLQARIKGNKKLDDISSTNPVAVGDWVIYTLEKEKGNIATIHQIKDRKNYVVRKSPHNDRKFSILASNIDQALLIATLKNPVTSWGFIDRFLIACEMQQIPVVILFNKSDLYESKERSIYEKMKAVYSDCGYTVMLTSLKSEKGTIEVKKRLQNSTTLIAGHSGVGKSTLVNSIIPDMDIKTLEVSEWSGKGMHTTTYAQMHDLSFGGKLIDTPGIRELGLNDLEPTELSQYYPEMREVLQQCKFNNCLHKEEPGCAVKEAVSLGRISIERYEGYLHILKEL